MYNSREIEWIHDTIVEVWSSHNCMHSNPVLCSVLLSRIHSRFLAACHTLVLHKRATKRLTRQPHELRLSVQAIYVVDTTYLRKNYHTHFATDYRTAIAVATATKLTTPHPPHTTAHPLDCASSTVLVVPTAVKPPVVDAGGALVVVVAAVGAVVAMVVVKVVGSVVGV